MKRITSLVLITVLLVCMLCPYASATMVEPRWDYVSTITGDLEITSGGTAVVDADGTAANYGVTRVHLTASLQQKDGTWKELKSWSVAADARGVIMPTKYWAVAHDYEYRLVITVKAYKNSTLLETATATIDYGYYD